MRLALGDCLNCLSTVLYLTLTSEPCSSKYWNAIHEFSLKIFIESTVDLEMPRSPKNLYMELSVDFDIGTTGV